MTVWLNPNYTKPKSRVHKVDGTEAQNQAINTIAEEFEVRKEHLEAIVKQFREEMRKGLQHDGATVAMIPSFVTGRPTGQEKGRYLALDLGGTNLRVCEFLLEGNGKHSVKQQKFVVSEQLKRGEFRHLCDYIADCVDTFITEHGSLEDSDGELQLGFTFSFPVWQTEINRGVLKQWTKGFSCPGAVDKDVTIMLQDAFRKKNIPVHIAAIVNDTVGTLMAYAYSEPSTAMGVIMGTGSNASYYEKFSNIKKWSRGPTGSDEMVINMEWGAFDCERRVLPLTIYDNKLDRESINVGQQLYEKMISGMYLGEITRNCMLQLIDRYLLFNGQSSQELNKQWSFETAYMSAIECDDTPDLIETKRILESTLNIPSTTLADRQIVKKISHFVGRRAARLSACGLSAVMSHTGALDKDGIIAIDGSLYEFYPNYENNMRQALSELYDAETAAKFKFALARDGSGLGAAIIAMMAHKNEMQKKQQQQH